MIVTIRTDNPLAEIGVYDGHEQKSYKQWQAHRLLSETILSELVDQLAACKATLADISGIVFYEGPGSFTGLRIGASVVNAIAVTNNASVSNKTGDKWIEHGITELSNDSASPLAIPQYGSDPHITAQKK